MKNPEMVRVLMMNVLSHQLRWGSVRVMARSSSPAGKALRVAPFEIRPADIAKSTMVTTGGTSKRLDKLEKSDLVERVPNSTGDGRSKLAPFWLIHHHTPDEGRRRCVVSVRSRAFRQQRCGIECSFRPTDIPIGIPIFCGRYRELLILQVPGLLDA